jgi:hypothetical protein
MNNAFQRHTVCEQLIDSITTIRVYKFYILFYNMFRLFMAIIR